MMTDDVAGSNVLLDLFGHGYPEAPLFGMAPCPTTIVTFGLLLRAEPPIPHQVLVSPALWAVLAPPAAIAQGVTEDVALFITGVTAVVVVLVRDRRLRRQRGTGNGPPTAVLTGSRGVGHKTSHTAISTSQEVGP